MRLSVEVFTTRPGCWVTSNGMTPVTPSAGVSALSIVGDLLQKVGVSDLDALSLCSVIVLFLYANCS